MNVMNEKKPALFQKDFAMVVIGQVISLFGNAILRFALPLYLLRETGSPALFGAVSACSFLPMILFSLVGGVLADRLDKRNMMVGLDFGTASLILIFYLLHGKLPVVPMIIVCLMALYGIFGAYQPAVQASIPALVPRSQILPGNAVINMVSTLSGLLGPVIGGILFGAWGITPILIIAIFCFSFSAVMEIFIKIPYQKQEKKNGILAIVRDDGKESWLYIKNEKPVFLSVVIILALFNLVLSAAMIIGIPVIVVNILGMSDARLGLTQGALGLGGLAGGILSGLLGKKLRMRQSHLLLAGSAVTAGVMGGALLPGVPPLIGYSLITLMSFISMVQSTMFVIQMCSVVQQQTPSHLIGKIMAFLTSISSCATPIGQAMYGMLFSALTSAPWAIMFGSSAIALLISLYSKKSFVRLDEETG